MTDIKNYETFVKIESVDKGLSSDKKYYIETIDGQRLLLRVSDISEYDRKKAGFERMKLMDAANIPMSCPVDFGVCNDGKSVYQLLTWCDGESLETIIHSLTETEQYVIGLKAGEILRKIHSVPVAESDMTAETWNEQYSSFIDGSIQAFHDCGVKADGTEIILDYFNNNRYLLKSRPQCYMHNDYHVGNMMLSPEHKLTIIDWEILLHNNYGDPWKEISMQETPHFSTGMIRGYFGGEPPIEFFKLLAFYIASNTLSSVSWAISFGADQTDIMIKQAYDVLKWFDNMNNPVPTWYLKDFHVQWINGIPCRTSELFDFSFLKGYGKVFKVFDNQDSGCICFGVSDGKNKYFIKFAGVKTMRHHQHSHIPDAIDRLKDAVPKYIEMAHPLLIRFIEAKETGGGYMSVFDWFDGESFSVEIPVFHEKYLALPVDKKISIYEKILQFHEYVAECNYIAVDFNDYSVLYNFDTDELRICDIDF